MKLSQLISGISIVTLSLYNSAAHGQTWSAVGSGINAPALCMTEYNGNLYIGKINFSVADEINKWNGTAMTGVGTGTNGPVGAFVVNNNELVVGGGFSNAGGNAASDVAKWNGTVWTSVGSQMNNFAINAMAIYNNELYAGGYSFDFTQVSPSAFTIAKWNGSAWVGVGSGLQGGDVYGLCVYNNELYASGSFTNAGSTVTPHIAKWNGTTWSAVGSGTTDGAVVYTVKEHNGMLYAGGNFSTIGGITTNCIAKWNGTTWSAVGTTTTGANNTVVAIYSYNGYLYAGGAFGNVDGTIANHIARWNDTTWSALGSGIGVAGNVNDQVWCITAYNNKLYAAGTFATANGNTVNNIAQWSGPLGTTNIATVKSDIHIYPDPVTANSVIEISVPHSTSVRIDIYNVTGQKVANIYNGQLTTGKHTYTLANMKDMAAGVYFIKVTSNEGVSEKKFVKE